MLNLIFCLLLGTAGLDEAQQLANDGDYEGCAAVLKQLKPGDQNYAQYCFLMAVSAHANCQKEEALKWVKNLEGSFDEIPRRYAAVAFAMKEELAMWKVGDVADIGREMNLVATRLNVAKGGLKTQAVQKDIVDKLDKLIKDEEDDKKKSKGEKEKEQKEGRVIGKKVIPGDPNGIQAEQHAEESRPADGQGPGNVEAKKLRQLAQRWGEMPEKERTKALSDLTRDLPPKYREIIENYFKALATVEDSKNGRGK